MTFLTFLTFLPVLSLYACLLELSFPLVLSLIGSRCTRVLEMPALDATIWSCPLCTHICDAQLLRSPSFLLFAHNPLLAFTLTSYHLSTHRNLIHN